MEVVLEKAEGLPEGAVLSIRVGDTKRQAPASKTGQPFRFSSSPADPLAWQVEVLTPAAPLQELVCDPAADRMEVDFGEGMKVTLKVNPTDPSQRPPVDVGKVAEARGMGPEKLQVAQNAVAYLEEHDLVRTFQEILHGLLVAKPADPHTFVEERLARSKKMADKEKEAEKEIEDFGEDQPEQSTEFAPPRRASVRMQQRGSVQSRSKVDTLLLTLQSAADNLPVVLPLLPTSLRKSIESEDLRQECKRKFKDLAAKRSDSRLRPEDLLPVLVELTQARIGGVGTDQCSAVVEMFDSDGDGLLDEDDFVYLTQFVIVAGYLDTPDGRDIVETAFIEEGFFLDFIEMIEQDKERLWAIIPFLPQWLTDHVSSEAFMIQCKDHFKALDADGNGTLEPEELIPVIQQMSQAHPLTIDLEKTRRFVAIFDTHKNGVIMEDEFFEFAQFLTVMNFLSQTPEGRQIHERAMNITEASKTTKWLSALEADPCYLTDIMQRLPQAFVLELHSLAFKESCAREFDALDPERQGVVAIPDVVPIVCSLSRKHSYAVDEAQCIGYLGVYDKAMKGTVCKEEFAFAAQFVTVMGYLVYCKEHQDMLETEILLGEGKIQKLLAALREGVDKIADIIPFLPQPLTEELLSTAFAEQCIDDFKALDFDSSGVLEPAELMPVIKQMVSAHRLSLTEAHCRKFVEIFDADQTGVITEGEFVNFVRFLLIMAFMETEEGAKVIIDVERFKGQEQIEDLLRMLESDRRAVQKVVPVLPPDVYEQLTNDEFVLKCHDRFVQLDKDKTGVLRPHELYPVVVDLSSAHPYAVTEEQCKRFTAIFDLYGDGVLHPDEFLDFVRFICVMTYLNTPAGKEACSNALTIMQESKKIEELLQQLHADRRALHKVIPFLPEWLRHDLLSDHFTHQCLDTFATLDKDGNGTLEPEELFPVVMSLSKANEQQALDLDQCRRFTAIFDDCNNGVITKTDFVVFARFLIIMGFLRSQEGQEVLATAKQAELKAEEAKREASKPKPQPLPIEDVPLSPISQELDATGPQSPAHLQVDCEFYQKKSQKLTSENEDLRNRVHDLETMMRRLEATMEEQSMRLRHAEVDLRASGRR